MPTDSPHKDHADGRKRWNDSRVAVPTLFDNHYRPTQTHPAKVNMGGSSPDRGGPIIVESSAEHAHIDDINKGGSGDIDSRVMMKASALPFSCDMTQFQISTHGTRYVVIDGFKSASDVALQHNIQTAWIHKIRSRKVFHDWENRRISLWLEFFDIRDAITAVAELRTLHDACQVHHVIEAQYSMIVDQRANSRIPCNTSKFDGQVMFIVQPIGPTQDPIERCQVDTHVLEVAMAFGDVRAFKEVTPHSAPAWQFKVEYWNIKAADRAISTMPPECYQEYKDWIIFTKGIVDLSGDSLAYTRPYGGTVGIKKSVTGRTAWTVDENGTETPQQPACHIPKVTIDHAESGPIGNDTPFRARYYSEPSVNTSGASDLTPAGPRSNSFGGPLTLHYMHSKDPKRMREEEATRIDPEKILNNRDYRTTIMIRNLPNHWTCHDMKAELDAVIFGRYDFSYLRIDFTTNTNVGYCFVNCLSTDEVLAMYTHWSGRRLSFNAKKEAKICSVSYASNQGTDVLVDRFRNSSVMDEFKDFRPMLWYTIASARHSDEVGTQRPFPPSNNHYKKQRSQDNAGQIGLYAPRSRFQNGNRTNHSQYDRGTPSQLQEEARYNLTSSYGGYMANNQLMNQHMAQSHNYGMGRYNSFGTTSAAFPRTMPNPINLNAGMCGSTYYPTGFNTGTGTPNINMHTPANAPGGYGGQVHHQNGNRGFNGGAGHVNSYNGNQAGRHGSDVAGQRAYAHDVDHSSGGVDGQRTPRANGYGGDVTR